MNKSIGCMTKRKSRSRLAMSIVVPMLATAISSANAKPGTTALGIGLSKNNGSYTMVTQKGRLAPEGFVSKWRHRRVGATMAKNNGAYRYHGVKNQLRVAESAASGTYDERKISAKRRRSRHGSPGKYSF